MEVEALHDAIELEADVPVATGDSAGYSTDAVEEDAIEENEEAAALDDVIPSTPAFGETVELQQALDDGLTIVDGPDAEATAEDAPVLGTDARHEALDERDAFAEAEAGLSDAEEASPPAPLFELEDARCPPPLRRTKRPSKKRNSTMPVRWTSACWTANWSTSSSRKARTCSTIAMA